MYEIIIKPNLEKRLLRLKQKHSTLISIFFKKIKEIATNPHHYKNLRKPLQKYKRVHVDSHFVLLFSINEEKKEIILEKLTHHNEAYN